MLYKKKAKKAPATPRVRAGSSMPAAPVEEAVAALEDPEGDEPPSDPAPPVEVGLEPEEPDEPDEPEEPAVPEALELPDELEPPDVLLWPDPPIGVVELPPEVPPVAVALPAPDVGTTTGTRVVLDTTG